MKVNKPVMILFILFIFFSLFLSANAQSWELFSQSGEWVICERTHIKKEGANVGYAEWQTSVTDFTGYWFKFTVATWENWRNWWDYESDNNLWIKIKIQTETATLWLNTRILGTTWGFGLLQQRTFAWGSSVSASDWDDVVIGNPTYLGYDWTVIFWQPSNFEYFIFNEGDKLTIYLFLYVVPYKAYLITKTYNATNLSANATVTLIYEHNGHGKIEAYINDSFTLPAYPPYELRGGVSGFFDFWMEIMKLDYLGIFRTLVICVKLVVDIVRISLPFMGFFLLFWVLDVVITGITTGNISLIGDFFLKIYDFLRGVWQTLVNLANAIWDFITFWS